MKCLRLKDAVQPREKQPREGRKDDEAWCLLLSPEMLDQVSVIAQGRRGSRTLFDGIALFDPVGRKAGGEKQDAEMNEAQFVKSSEGRAKIRATVERAAAAVNDDI